MKLYIFLIFILYLSDTQSVYNKGSDSQEIPSLQINVGRGNEDSKSSVKKELNTTNGLLSSKDAHITSTEKSKEFNYTNIAYRTPVVESGAMIRGVLVFVGIGLLFIIYLGCKTYRNKKPVPIIKKYGIRTKRSDVEMEPLPLDEDEEDETLFDVGNINRT